MSRMKTRTASYVLAALIALTSATFAGGDAKIEQALRDLDAQWSQAAGAKDVTKAVSYYSDDAIVLPPNQRSITGKDGIRQMWQGLLDSVDKISWKPTRVVVAKSGDMAFVTGTYEITPKSTGSGSATADRGKYLVAWEKQPDGTWKCGADMFSSDLPAAAPAK